MIASAVNMSDRQGFGIRRGRGFSLTELMISIGILAVGMVMVGSLFPAAMQANRRSVNNVLGSIICENGLSIAKARWASLTKEDFQANAGELKGFRDAGVRFDKLEVLADDAVGTPNFLSDLDRAYPVGATKDTSKYGFVLMMRPMDEDGDTKTFEGFQLVATSYRRQLDNSSVICQALLGVLLRDDEEIRSYTEGSLRAGSPVIDRDTGAFSTMTSASPYNGRLDHPMKDVTSFFVVVEVDPNVVDSDPTDPTLHPAQMRFSPAMATMVTRTGLTGNWARQP